MAESLLAIDCGTQSVRALLFNPRGELIAKSRQIIQPYYSPAPGLAEQDPNVYWEALRAACHDLFEQEHVDKTSIAGVSLTAQRATVVNLDKDGVPLRPAIVWMDQRRTETFTPVGGLWGAAFMLAGARPTVNYLQAEAEANWISSNQPEIWEKTFKFTYLSGFLTRRLTGRFVDSVGCQVGYMPFDYKKQDWAANSHWYWQALTITREKLVELVPVTDTLGEITRQAASETGIPAGLPLIAAAADKACEVLGAGSLESNVACLSYGTAATINSTHSKYIEIIPLIPPYPAAVPGYYNMEMQIYRGYWMVSWFKQEFGQYELNLAEEQGVEAEHLLDDLVNDVPPGSQGLVLQPFWSPGLRYPGPEARGAIVGFNDTHTRAHIYRAILEGIAYALREGKERTERRARTTINQVRVAGGGSQSDVAMQITADIFGMPASRPHIYEASGLGAAMNAAVGTGVHSDHSAALAAMTRPGVTFDPNPDNARVYNDLYHSIYRKMYRRLKPLYTAMQDIHLPEQ